MKTPMPPMPPAPMGHQPPPDDSGRTYDRSVKIGDPGGATPDNPKPTRQFVNPDPKSIHTFDLDER